MEMETFRFQQARFQNRMMLNKGILPPSSLLSGAKIRTGQNARPNSDCHYKKTYT